MDSVLIVSADACSLTFSIFCPAEDRARVWGAIEGIGGGSEFIVTIGESRQPMRIAAPHLLSHALAIQFIGEWLRAQLDIAPMAVGHKILHGGAEFDRPTVISPGVLETLARLEVLAPRKQPHSISVIRNLMVRFPDLFQVACFDTSFHRTHGPLADRYAIPRPLHEAGVRRYGFHGLAYESVTEQLRELDPALATGRTIIVRLDAESSMCAVTDGSSVECTMGFSTLGGLPMRTRPGDLDPDVVLYLIKQRRMAPSDVEQLLYEEAGLKGLSGLSGDVRELSRSSDPAARFAIDYFVYRIALAAGSLVSALGGLDGVVFTGQIGSTDSLTRKRVIDKLNWLGLRLSEEANDRGDTVISQSGSSGKIFVIPSHEELVVARHTFEALARLSPR